MGICYSSNQKQIQAISFERRDQFFNFYSMRVFIPPKNKALLWLFPSLPSPKLYVTKHNTSQLSILEKWSEIHSNWCCILWFCVFKSHNILWAPKEPQRRTSGPFPIIKLIYKWRHPGQKALGSTMLQVAQVTSEPVQVLSLKANSLPIPYSPSN